MKFLKNWKLLLTTLPVIALALGLRYLIIKLGLPHELKLSEIGIVLSGGIFLIGFMLSGTMSDYKESEKLPADIACTLETIEESVRWTESSKTLDGLSVRKKVVQTSQDIIDWLHKRRTTDQVFFSLHELGDSLLAIERAGLSAAAGRAFTELHNLRKMISRMNVISKTSFLGSGYALLYSVVFGAIGMTLITDYPNALAQYVVIGFVSFIFTYMVRLIRDLDDPFEYHEGGIAGAADVELFPLLEYHARAEERLK